MSENQNDDIVQPKQKRERLPRIWANTPGQGWSDIRGDKRWITDSLDRRIGHMWPEDFIAHCQVIYPHAWQSRTAVWMGVDLETIRSWINGKTPIPKFAAELVLLRRAAIERDKVTHNRVGYLGLVRPTWLDDAFPTEQTNAKGRKARS